MAKVAPKPDKNLSNCSKSQTKETVKHHSPSYHTDLAVHKIHDDNSTYIRVATG